MVSGIEGAVNLSFLVIGHSSLVIWGWEFGVWGLVSMTPNWSLVTEHWSLSAPPASHSELL